MKEWKLLTFQSRKANSNGYSEDVTAPNESRSAWRFMRIIDDGCIFTDIGHMILCLKLQSFTHDSCQVVNANKNAIKGSTPRVPECHRKCRRVLPERQGQEFEGLVSYPQVSCVAP